MTLMATILHEIETFCETHKVPPTQFGLLAMNDKAFVSQVRNGRRLWPETEAKVRGFMREYQPATPHQSAA